MEETHVVEIRELVGDSNIVSVAVFMAQRKISGGLKKKYLSLQHGFDT